MRTCVCSVINLMNDHKAWLCNQCISRVLCMKESEVRPVTRSLGYVPRYYIRTSGVPCSLCGVASLCIRSLDS